MECPQGDRREAGFPSVNRMRMNKLEVCPAFALTLVVWCCVGLARADDWPVFQQNHQRNAKTAEQLPAEDLVLSWTWQSPQTPQPAWWGPAKWDAYAGVRGLKSMRNYDPVFHPIAVGDRIWFGSTVDDAVHCLDANTGNEVWSYCTDGPVRAPPSFYEGRLYFGSDDGFAYCVNADGQLVWKFEPHACSRKIVNNGRFVSSWPCAPAYWSKMKKRFLAHRSFRGKNRISAPWMPGRGLTISRDALSVACMRRQWKAPWPFFPAEPWFLLKVASPPSCLICRMVDRWAS